MTSAPHSTEPVEAGPPRSSKAIGGFAIAACAACCAFPLFVAAGLLTGAGAALLTNVFVALAVAGAVIAVGLWFRHYRRVTRAAAAKGVGGCAGGNCSC
ncbi:hypothetical protein [Lentzea sp. NPDC003310]|uniref:hypothetical protein n=1 Tax=Lentzea sp. NPDC003310 TaxID=3154447 RepID=UPI0033AF3941